MTNELTLFENSLGGALTPRQQAFASKHTNVIVQQGVPTLAYRGRRWSIVKNGERQTLMRRTAEGDEEAVNMIKVVIVDCAPYRGRAYYAGKFDPDKPAAPDCWSADSKTPSKHVKQPQSFACDKCPQSIKGSKTNELGRATTACQSHHLLAVVPAHDMSSEPLRLKLAITSIYDGQSPDLEKAGWLAFDQYRKYLAARGINHTGSVVTKMKFDPNVDYPKIVFAPERRLDGDALDIVEKMIESGAVKHLITDQYIPNEDGTKADEAEGTVQKQAVVERPKVIEATAVKEDTGKKPPARQPKKPEPEQEAEASTEVPEDVQNLMSAWA